MAYLLEKYGWHEWICHTNFSFLKGASHPVDLIKKAAWYGYRSLGITDYDGVYGIARAHRELIRLKSLGLSTDLKLHFGAEIHLSKDHSLPLCFQDTLVLLALTHKGYRNLCSLLTSAHKEGKKEPSLSLEDLLNTPVNDIVAIQPMRGLIRQMGREASTFRERCGKLKEHFNGRLYFAISRHMHRAEDEWILPALSLSKSINAPTLLSQDIFFHSKRQKRVSDLLHAIRHNKTLAEVTDQLFVNSFRRPLPLASLAKVYSSLPLYEASLKNSRELSDLFDFTLGELKYSYPKEMIPENFSSQEYLEHLVWDGCKSKYGSPVPEKIVTTLKHELKLVNELQFADYFLTVYDIVKWARSRKILCQGRGSAANSAICFVLGVTSVDPAHFDLLFERFLNLERGDPPDIDVDFEHERREEVIQYIYEHYGRKRAAMLCNVIYFRSKGAMASAGKALGIPENFITRTSKILSGRAYRKSPASETVNLVKEQAGQTQSLSQDDPRWSLWGELAEELMEFPRHLGIHSGGFILSDKPIDWLCPQEPATMEGRTVIEWSKEDVEGLGFFKVDILALGGLTLIRKCLDLIKEHYSVSLTLASIPGDDPETYKMLQRGDTTGTFQVESRAQISFLSKHKPKNFYDLVVQVAIIRPGPIQGGVIHPYLKRRSGKEAVSYPLPCLEPILKRTYGVPIFQEQVMRIAIAVGNFSPGEADELRKSIGSFSVNKNKARLWIEKLISGMRKNGIDETFIEGIMRHIEGFSSYGFPESHAASFALIAYATSYLKCHYPAAFFTAILNSQPMGFYAPDTLLKTAQHAGVSVLPLCVRASHWDHSLEKTGNAEEGQYGIRLGFRLVKGVSRKGVESLVSHREQQGGWENIGVFFKESSLNRTDLTALAAADVFKSFGLERKSALWLSEASPFTPLLEEDEPRVLFTPEKPLEAVELDYKATSTSCGPHPVELIKREEWNFGLPLNLLTKADAVKTLKGPNKYIYLFGMVVCRQAPPTAKGVVFITLWDETGSFDLVVKPTTYKKYQQFIDENPFLCISGILQSAEDRGSVLVKIVHKPLPHKAKILHLKQRSKKIQEKERALLHKVRNYM